MTKEERLEYYKNDGKPVMPEGYDEMDDEAPQKQSYDLSLAHNEKQIASIEAELAELAEILRKEEEKAGKFAVKEEE